MPRGPPLQLAPWVLAGRFPALGLDHAGQCGACREAGGWRKILTAFPAGRASLWEGVGAALQA